MTTQRQDGSRRIGGWLPLAMIATGGLLIGACDREPGLEENDELGVDFEPEDRPRLGDPLVEEDDPLVQEDEIVDPLAGRAGDPVVDPRVGRAIDPNLGATQEQLGGGEIDVAIRAPEGGEVRVGATLEYTIVVQNTSDDMVRAMTVHNYLPESFEFIESMPPHQQQDARARMNAAGMQNARPVEAGFEREQDEMGQPRRQGQQEEQAGQQRQAGQQQPGEQQQQPGQQQLPRQQQQAQREGAAGAMQASYSPEQVSWRIGQLAPGESEEIVVRGIAKQEGPIDACVTVSYDPAICAQFMAVKPELRLLRAFAVEGDQVYVCDEIPIVYRVINEGTAATEAVTIQEELPEGLVNVDGERSIRLQLEPLGPGETAEERILVRAEHGGEFSGRALASTPALEVQSGRSSIRVLDPSLALRVDAPQQQYLGRVVTFGVELQNTSDVPVIDTMVRWTPPENGMRFGTTGAVEERDDGFFIGTLDPGEVRRFDVSFEGTLPGTIDSTFVAEAYCVERIEQPVQTELVGIEAVRLEMIDLTDPVSVGEITTYEIRVKNQGTAASINVRLEAELPAQLEFVTAEGDSQVRSEGNTLSFSPVPELPPGEIATWRIAARASEAGKVRFRVELKTDATPRAVSEIEPTTLF